jgi:4-amino-4-deoxychorismate lyase
MSILDINEINILVESLRVEKYSNTTLVYNLDLHLARLLKSIEILNFKLPSKDLTQNKLFFYNQIKNFVQYQFKSVCGFQENTIPNNEKLNQNFSLYKLRIEYDKNSQIKIESQEYKKNPNKIWQIKILKPSDFFIQSQNPVWKHKYLPRKNFDLDDCDEVIWLNEKNEICEGSFTNVFWKKENQIYTSDLNCNILPGIMRSMVIAKTNAREVFKPISELKTADKIFLTNAVVGMIEAKILD